MVPFAIKACIIKLFVRDLIWSKSVICNKVLVAKRGCCLHSRLAMPLPSASHYATSCPGIQCGRAHRRYLFLHPDQCSEIKATVHFLVVRGALWEPDPLFWHSLIVCLVRQLDWHAVWEQRNAATGGGESPWHIDGSWGSPRSLKGAAVDRVSSGGGWTWGGRC